MEFSRELNYIDEVLFVMFWEEWEQFDFILGFRLLFLFQVLIFAIFRLVLVIHDRLSIETRLTTTDENPS